MDQNPKKVAISPSYNKPKPITIQSPNIDDSDILYTRKIYRTSSNEAAIVNEDTESEDFGGKLHRKHIGKPNAVSIHIKYE